MKCCLSSVVVLAFFISINALAQNIYYVRPDGGDNTQCTGLVDAPYPGSGTGQPCAWSHPFWALNQQGQWLIQGGDTLVIKRGSYRMGLGVRSMDICDSSYSWDCHLPSIPSGPSPERPTRILGEGWDSDCPAPPELWGTERASTILDLRETSNAIIACLEITDHSSCALDHCSPLVACERNTYPYGDYADIGILAYDSSNVTLQHLNIHGLAEEGVRAGLIRDWTVENVRIAGNAKAGWDGDYYGQESSYSGTIRFRNLVVEWNGCPESYPAGEPDHCWGQELCGGYGDGMGLTRSGGHFIIEDSIFRYNTSDGLDLLYVGVDHPDAQVELHRTQGYGNAGNQIKLGGTSRVINSLIVGNCAYFYQKPFAQEMGGIRDGNHCRAGGAALSVNLPRGRNAHVVNSTIVSEGWAVAELQCNNLDFPDQPPCDHSERVYMQNSIFMGYQVAYLDYDRLTDFIGDQDPYGFTNPETIDYNVIYRCYPGSMVPVGANNINQDPLFVNSDIENFDGHLQAQSPAIDRGRPVGDLGGLVPSDDLEGSSRVGLLPDLGALEYVGATVCRITCSATVPPRGQVGVALNFEGTSNLSEACTGPLSYDWDFGDGSLHSTDIAATHTYGQSGVYTWRFTASSQADSVSCQRSGSIEVGLWRLTVTRLGQGSGTVTSDPQGIDCGADCTESYPAETVVTLRAEASSGSLFAGWGGACSGSSDTCQVTMDGDKTVTATFNLASGPDLVGQWIVGPTQTCKGTGPSMKCKIKGRIQVTNIGNEAAPTSSVLRFYLSSDDVLDSEDVVLKQVAVGALKPGRSQSKNFSCSLPRRESAAGSYVIAQIDDGDTIEEVNEENNTVVSTSL